MSSRLIDTKPTAEQVQIELLRHAGMIRRVDLAAEMTSFAINGARTALSRHYPEANELEIRLMFAEQQYGLTLATRLRATLMPQVENRDIIS